MSSSDTNLSIFVDEFVLDILYHLHRRRLLRNRSNPLEGFDDLNFKGEGSQPTQLHLR
jgi:hypothetical protein